MTESEEEDFVPTEGVEEEGRRALRRRKSSSELARTKQKVQKLPTTNKRRKSLLPSSVDEVEAKLSDITKQIRGRDIDQNVSLRVLKCALELHKEHLTRQAKAGTAIARLGNAEIRPTVQKLLGVGSNTYQAIMTQFLSEESVYASGVQGSGRAGNRNVKYTRIPKTQAVVHGVRDFVRGRRTKRERVTARQVLDWFVEQGYLAVPKDSKGKYEKKPFENAYRATRRWIEAHGYERGKRTGNLVPSEKNLLMKQHYLQRFFDNRKAELSQRKREVYLDESYIHEHYHRNDDSIWDPNDEQDVKHSKDPAKGRRYCFAAAIQGPDPTILLSVEKEEKAGLVPGSLWAFCPQKKGGHTGDYHKVFDGDNFTKWFKEQLLPGLKQPSLIMMDNAKYHLVYGSHVPKVGKLKKTELQAYLQQKGVEYGPSSTAVQLRKLAKDWVNANEKPEIFRLAEEQGHEVLLTPPYHSDLQPIELVWARIKGNVGRQYSKESTLDLVYQRLVHEFDMLDSNEARGKLNSMIEKCATVALDFYNKMEEEDDTAEEEEDEAIGIIGVGGDGDTSASEDDLDPLEDSKMPALPSVGTSMNYETSDVQALATI